MTEKNGFIPLIDNLVPISSCTLSDKDQVQRMKVIREDIFSRIETKENLVLGIKMKFTYSKTIFHEIVDFVDFEGQCCSFLNFSINISHPEFIELIVTDRTKNSQTIDWLHKM